MVGVGPALIQAGGSLLGGLFGKKAPSAGQNAYSHVKGIMRAADAFGFNPLTLLGAVTPMAGSATPNYMGEAISNAAAIAADALSRRGAPAARLQRAEEENERLQRKVDRLSLRPNVPGVYNGVGVSADVSPLRAHSSVVDADSGWRFNPVGAPVRDVVGSDVLGDVDAIDPRRAVEHKPVPTSPGVLKVDNPHLPFPVYVPSVDGDEVLGPDIITVPLSIAASGVYAWSEKRQNDRWNRLFMEWAEAQRKGDSAASGETRKSRAWYKPRYHPMDRFGTGAWALY
jgi:hypothetical protein